jgi:hypothetical protein
MRILSLFLLLQGIWPSVSKPLNSQKPSATLTTNPNFVDNAIIPTESGQIGINPVDVPLKED